MSQARITAPAAAPNVNPWLAVAPSALTIFAGAFLLFQVQPVIARYILPWFGGSPALWTACMLFFQAALLAGYAYAHALQRWLPPRGQVALHLILLACSLACLPIEPAASFKPMAESNPLLLVIGLLAVTIGFPYMLLAATSPLLQHWFTRAHAGRSPYRLFALSNLGSLLGLLSYPFLVEPLFGLHEQTLLWTAGYAVFVIACAACALGLWQAVAPCSSGCAAEPKSGGTLAWPDRVLWFVLPAIASAALLATTNKISQNIAVVPFLWVLPLGLYLISFIACFDHERWYDRRLWIPLHLASIGLATWLLFHQLTHDLHIIAFIAICTGAMFVWCMVCHGELVRRKPDPGHLTAFYLTVAAGGAGGGIFVTALAPALFRDYWEYQLSILSALLVVGLVIVGRSAGMPNSRRAWLVPSWVLASIALAVALLVQIERYDSGALETRRSFYGVMRVYDEEVSWTRRLSALAEGQSPEAPLHQRTLFSGEIMHGSQFMDPVLGRVPTTYYGWDTGAGAAIQYHPKRFAADGDTSLKIAAVGLGAGTLAAHLQPGDELRFYEINPDVVALNKQYFSYLDDSRGDVEIVLADGRIGLEADLARDGPGGFDVIVLDAFSGDSIPVHLLTTEAFALYRRQLKPDGILAVHISNRHIDLKPVVRAAAAAMNYSALLTISEEQMAITQESDWMLVTRNQRFLDDRHLRAIAYRQSPSDTRPLLWTDDYSSLMGLFY